jgi:hypothetical protein
MRDFADLGWTLLDAPGRSIEAARIDPAAHRHHLEKSAEPIREERVEFRLRR